MEFGKQFYDIAQTVKGWMTTTVADSSCHINAQKSVGSK